MIENIKNKQSGFSMVELIIVVVIVAIFAVLATTFASPTLYKADEKARVVVEFMQTARERAITKRSIMRVEIDDTDKKIRLIAENDPDDLEDDDLIRQVDYGQDPRIVVGNPPQNNQGNPTESTPVPTISFSSPIDYGSSNPLGNPPGFGSHQVATFRFKPNGNVVDEGIAATGASALPAGATIYFWTRSEDNSDQLSSNASVLRAITISGSSGSTRFWACEIKEGSCVEWQKND